MSENERQNDDENKGWGDWAWDIFKYALYETAIFTGTFVLSSMIVNWAKQTNPSLTDQQCERLQKLLHKAVNDYRFAGGGPQLENTILAILTLICPEDLDINQIFVSIISEDGGASDLNLTPEQQAERQMPSDVEFNTTKAEDSTSTALFKQYGIDHELVLKIPLELRPCLLEALKANPTCPISLEPVIDPSTGTITPGFTCLFQYVQGKPHAFLFDTASIEGWIQQHNTNPVTRQGVNRKEFLQLS